MYNQIHRGHYLQRGRGLGGIFSSLMKILKPVFSKGMQMGKKALADPAIKKAVAKLKKSSIKAGTRVINKEIGKIAAPPPAPTIETIVPSTTKTIKLVKKRPRKITTNNIKKQKKSKPTQSQNLFNSF